MKTFVLYWPDGCQEEVTGEDISQAFRDAGYDVTHWTCLVDYHEKGKPSEAQRLLHKQNRDVAVEQWSDFMLDSRD